MPLAFGGRLLPNCERRDGRSRLAVSGTHAISASVPSTEDHHVLTARLDLLRRRISGYHAGPEPVSSAVICSRRRSGGSIPS